MNDLNAPPALTPAEELARLRLLQEFKRHLTRDDKRNLSPFDEEMIVRQGTKVDRWDVPVIHQSVRELIVETLQEIRKGTPPKIIILAGEPGMGKSHLLGWFRSPERAQEAGYVLVESNNYWKIEDFEKQLLDRVITALGGRPGDPGQPDLLLEKTEALAFHALGQILNQPPAALSQMLTARRGGFLRKLWNKLTGRAQARVHREWSERSLSVFRRLDFRRFAGHVCDRFLHERSNPFHRYVLHVLLRYLFEDERPLVLGWLRDCKVEESFLSRLGVEDRIDRNDKVMDTVKILQSLFSPEVATVLGTEGEHGDRVFFLVFDQLEGRKELFADDGDWLKFFAHLSEMYHTLPNVCILFTMTLSLYNRLHPKLELQFQERIRRDQRFVLQTLSDEDILAIYRKRLALWLGATLSHLLPELDSPHLRYLPFTQTEVLDIGNLRTIRDMLELFDRKFRQYLDHTVVMDDPRLDYLVSFREIDQEAQSDSRSIHEQGEAHLERVTELFNLFGEEIGAAFGVSCVHMERIKGSGNLQGLVLKLRAIPHDQRWVRIFLVRLGHTFNDKRDACTDLIFYKSTRRNFLWVVRAGSAPQDWEELKPGRIFVSNMPRETEIHLQAMLRMIHKKDLYQNKHDDKEHDDKGGKNVVDLWPRARDVALEELRGLYLGEMLRQVGDAMKALAGQPAEEDDEEGAQS